MKYAAFLRGINVGGNTIIKMADLSRVFESCGCTDVVTYIQSGNVVFSSPYSVPKLKTILESALKKEVSYTAPLVLRTEKEMKDILAHVPKSWHTDADTRRYIAYIIDPASAKDIAKDIPANPDVDSLAVGTHVVYMTTEKEGLMKSKFSKIIGTKAYKSITMRNQRTSEKVLELMKK